MFPQDLVAAASTQHPGLAAGAAVNSLVFITGINVLLKGLTVEGVLNSWLLGTAVYSAFGPGGYLLVCLYFIFGTLVSQLSRVAMPSQFDSVCLSDFSGCNMPASSRTVSATQHL